MRHPSAYETEVFDGLCGEVTRPAPAVPYETIAPLKGNAGDVEVGWASERVGAYLDEQSDTADRLRAQGWTLFPIEAGLTEAVLFQALRTEEA